MRLLVSLALLMPVTAHADPGHDTGSRSTAVKTERRSSYVVTAWTLAAIGGTGLAASVVTGLIARSRYNAELRNGNCSRSSIDQRVECSPFGLANTQSARTLSTIGAGIGMTGLAVLGAGLIAYVAAPRDAVTFAPTASRDGAGVVVVGRF